MAEYPMRSPETAHREVDDEGGLVVLPTRSEVKVLNPVGSLVYRLLDGKHSVEQIVQTVVDQFEIGAEQAETDVRAFLKELEGEGMLADATGEGK